MSTLTSTVTRTSFAWEEREEGVATFDVRTQLSIRCRANGIDSEQIAEDIEAHVIVEGKDIEATLVDARNVIEDTVSDLRADGFEVLETVDELMAKAEKLAEKLVEDEL